MIILRGSPALSAFRIQKLLSDFQQESLPVKGIYAEFVHVADLDSELSSEKKETLEKIIATGKPFKFKQGLDERLLDDEKCRLLFSANYDGDYTLNRMRHLLRVFHSISNRNESH